MAENMFYDVHDGLLTLYQCTAASNIPAGTPLAIGSATTTVYTLGATVTGFGDTGLLGYHFIGIADKDYSANESPITVWTKGVFKFLMVSAGVSATNTMCGVPIFASSGTIAIMSRPALHTGDVAIGTVVSVGANATGSSTWFLGKINPGRWRWTIENQGVTASANPVLAFPKRNNP